MRINQRIFFHKIDRIKLDFIIKFIHSLSKLKRIKGASMGTRQVGPATSCVNPMKLSGFVELFTLIILIKETFMIRPYFLKDMIKYFFRFLHFFTKINAMFDSKINESPSLFAHILKPM